MRFLLAIADDTVDPAYDFVRETYRPDRQGPRDDLYPHEFFDQPPYDGLLLSRAIVGDDRLRGRFSREQRSRLLREGAPAFLRYDPLRFGGLLMGDCGAFSYVNAAEPPYSIPDMVDFYATCGFTHGLSIDHVIRGYNERLDARRLADAGVPTEWRRRYALTLRLAESFLLCCYRRNTAFQPVGVAQGWSPRSYREAVRCLIAMGYDYVALGGLVPRTVLQVHHILQAVREVAPASIRLHLLGFAKADNLAQFAPYRIESFDSTSPMLRAFKDRRRNYLAPDQWYTAIRVPLASRYPACRRQEPATLRPAHRRLRVLERRALCRLREYAHHRVSLNDALYPVLAYERRLGRESRHQAYAKTLRARPWERCACRACRDAGIDVLMYRGANRNRRRGFHNLWTFYQRLRALKEACEEKQLPGQPPRRKQVCGHPAPPPGAKSTGSAAG